MRNEASIKVTRIDSNASLQPDDNSNSKTNIQSLREEIAQKMDHGRS